LRAAIAAGALPSIAREIAGAPASRALSSVTFLPTISDADKIICIGRNYKAHVAESGGKPLEFPSVFIRLATSQVGHGQPIRLSKLSTDYDYEGELALVIGTGGRHIARERAMSHIAGYACFNEACYRDFQFKHSLTIGKNFARSGSFGPWMTTADEIPDPSALELTTRLNGVQVQHASVSELIFDVPYLVSYLSGVTELVPGDVIVTGTPEGVGFARTPPLWLKAGDDVEVEISGIGILRNKVEHE
jgi:2-keto-4-pentenoate hydratase/2-oxohepta-3-ene-1,7-dioic acid hydratase in catechol pathway